MTTANLAHLLPPSWKTEVSRWYHEDTPSFDWAGIVVGEEEQEAFLWAKSGGMLAGVPFFDEIFKQVECTVEWLLTEGSALPANTKTKVAIVRGKARHLLLGERVALNTLARCSGIASVSHRFKTIADASSWPGVIAGTRKTTPGFRLVEKYGMMVGGIDPHRHDLSSMVMLKDNHIWACGSITNAITTLRRAAGFSLLVTIECQSYAEAAEALEAGANIVMLDNLVGEELHSAARELKRVYGKGGKGREFLIESSGGIVESGLLERLGPDIDILSTSAVHQSVQHVDFSLKIQPKKKATVSDSDSIGWEPVGMLLPDVVIGRIAELFIKDFWGPRYIKLPATGPPKFIIPLLTVSKKVSAIALPLFYKTIHLSSETQCKGLLRLPHIRSYKHIRAIYLDFTAAPPCGSGAWNVIQESMFRSRLEGFREGQKFAGMGDEEDGSWIKGCMPDGVVVGISGVSTFMPAIFDLFNITSIAMHKNAALSLPSPDAPDHRLKTVTVYTPMLYEPWVHAHLSNGLISSTIPSWSSTIDEVKYILTCKLPMATTPARHTDILHDTDDYLHYILRQFVQPDVIVDETGRTVPNKEKGKPRAYPNVTIKHMSFPHIFCVGSGEEARRSLGLHSKIKLACCEGGCNVVKSEGEIELDRLFRGDLDLEPESPGPAAFGIFGGALAGLFGAALSAVPGAGAGAGAAMGTGGPGQEQPPIGAGAAGVGVHLTAPGAPVTAGPMAPPVQAGSSVHDQPAPATPAAAQPGAAGATATVTPSTNAHPLPPAAGTSGPNVSLPAGHDHVYHHSYATTFLGPIMLYGSGTGGPMAQPGAANGLNATAPMPMTTDTVTTTAATANNGQHATSTATGAVATSSVEAAAPPLPTTTAQPGANHAVNSNTATANANPNVNANANTNALLETFLLGSLMMAGLGGGPPRDELPIPASELSTPEMDDDPDAEAFAPSDTNEEEEEELKH